MIKDLQEWASELDSIVLSAALGMSRYNSPAARTMLAAIAAHESGGLAIFQRRPSGFPYTRYARGLWQFERTGVAGLPQTALAVLNELDSGLGERIKHNPEDVWRSLPWDHVTAARIARALLYTIPKPLPQPQPESSNNAFHQYVSAWRPGAYLKKSNKHKRQAIRDRWETIWQTLTLRNQ